MSGETIFDRIDFRTKYNNDFDNKHKKAKVFLERNKNSLSYLLPILKEQEFMHNLSRHDEIVILDILFSLKKNLPIKFYFCDAWEVFAKNIEIHDKFAKK